MYIIPLKSIARPASDATRNTPELLFADQERQRRKEQPQPAERNRRSRRPPESSQQKAYQRDHHQNQVRRNHVITPGYYSLTPSLRRDPLEAAPCRAGVVSINRAFVTRDIPLCLSGNRHAVKHWPTGASIAPAAEETRRRYEGILHKLVVSHQCPAGLAEIHLIGVADLRRPHQRLSQ